MCELTFLNFFQTENFATVEDDGGLDAGRVDEIF